MPVKLFRKRALQSLAESLTSIVLVEERPICDGNVRMKFVKSRFMGGELCPSLSDYDKLRNTVKASETESCVLNEER